MTGPWLHRQLGEKSAYDKDSDRDNYVINTGSLVMMKIAITI